MRRVVALAVLLALWAAAPAAAGEIVVLQSTDDPVSVETAEREDDLDFEADRRFSRAITGFAAELDRDQIAELRADPEVAMVVPDRRVSAQDFVLATNPVPPGVRRVIRAPAPDAVREAATGAVAVVDTGIDLTHPDLDARPGVDCTDSGGPDDDSGHGTHVAGTIAAHNDGVGATGVAPGTTVYAVKVLDRHGDGRSSTVICGIEWILRNAAAREITVANFSLGGEGQALGCRNDPEQAAFCRLAAAGVTPVVAAGNSERDFAGAEGELPAAYPQVLTVSATAETDGLPGGAGAPASCDGAPDDRFASFSNFATTAAAEAHLVAAPGVCIRSTWPGGGTRSMSGTSMAAPHVAGLAALCHGEADGLGPCAGLTTPQVIARLRDGGADAAITGFLGRLYGPLALLSDPAAPTPPAVEPYDPPQRKPAPQPPEEAVAPPAAPAPQPAPAPAPAPAAERPPVVAPPSLLVAAPRLRSLARRGLAVELRCPAACAGRVELRVPRSVARALGLRSRTLARATASGAGLVALRPTRSARRGLARAAAVAVDVVADLRTPQGAVRLTRRLTVRR